MARRKVSFIITARNKGFIKALEQSQRRLKRFGFKMERMGRTLTRNITVPVGIAGGAAIKMAADFEASLSKIEGLVGLSRKEIQGMRGDVLRLAGETSRAPQELADALFFVTSAGLRGADAIAVLEASARAAAAGLGETKVVADLVTSAVNAYGIENLSAAEATDILTAAVREGKAEAPDLASSLGQVLPVASEMGVTFNQVGAAVAAMTRTGTDAQTAATQLRQILFKLLKPAAESEQAFRKMGTSGAELRKELREKGLISVLGFLREQMKTNEQAMAQAFPRVQALAGALDLMGSNAEENIKIFERMTDTTGTADKAFDAAAQTTEFKFNKALSNLKSSAIELGTVLLPVVVKIVEKIDSLISRFDGLSDSAKANTLIYAALAAAIGPVLIATGKLIKGFGVLVGVIPKLVKLVKGLTAVMVANPYLAVAGAIALLTVRIISARRETERYEQAVKKIMEQGAKNWQEVNEQIAETARRMEAFKENMPEEAAIKTDEYKELEKRLNNLIKIRDRLAAQEAEAAIKTPEVSGGSATPSTPQFRGSTTMIGQVANIGEVSKVSAGMVERNFERMRAAGAKFSSVTEAAFHNVGDTAKKTTLIAGAFGETMANAFAQAALHGRNLLEVLSNIGKQLAARGFIKGIGMLLTGGFSLGGLVGSIFGVGDALITSKGDVVRFHPDDNILAMKDFGNLRPAASGSQVIKNIMMLDGQTVWENQRKVNTRKRR